VAIYYKKKHISMNLVESNAIAIQKWKTVFSMLDSIIREPEEEEYSRA